MAQRSRLSTGLSGVAGEYFVAAELSRRGYIASITLRNTRGIDILASDAEMRKFSDPKDKYKNRWELMGLGEPAI